MAPAVVWLATAVVWVGDRAVVWVATEVFVGDLRGSGLPLDPNG